MKTNSPPSRQQHLQLLRLRCQLERKQLQLQAIEMRTDYALIDELGGAVVKLKFAPLVIATTAAGLLLFRSKRSETFLRTGLKLWGLWHRFSPLIKLIRSRFDDRKSA